MTKGNDMKPAQRILRLSLLAIALLATGCSTPRPVRDLAAQGAVVVDRAETESRAFIDRATQSYKRREAIVLELAAGDIGDRGTADFNAWVAGEAGFPNDRARATLIKRIADESRASRERVQAELDKKSKEISGSFGQPVQAPAKNLAEAKKAFLNLAQELSPKEWLEFSFKYAKQVRADLKALDDASAPAEPPK
jgi:hypothetical protein